MPESPRSGGRPIEDIGADGGETRRPATGAHRSTGEAEASDGLAEPSPPISAPVVDGGRLFDDGPLIASRSPTSGGRLTEFTAGWLQREERSAAGAELRGPGGSPSDGGTAAPLLPPSPAEASREQGKSDRTRSAGDGSAPPAPPSRGAERRRGHRRSGSADDGAAAADGQSEDDTANPEEVARQICLRALTGASRTRKQLADLLQRKEVPDDAASAVLNRLAEVGLVDDAAFAAAWVRSRQAGRGLARRALSSELRAKGVDPEIASAALEEVDPQDEWDTARRLVARKLPGMARLDRPVAERRLIGMLARKGYGGGLAGYVVREALDDRDSELLAADEAADDGTDAHVSAGGARVAVPDEVGEGLARPLRQRGAGPRPDWLVDDTP